MAWISVHESIDGPKLRSLYKRLGCSKFEAVGILNFLWLWGMRNADKGGYVMYADEEDVLKYLSGVSSGCQFSAEEILDSLIETEWLEREEGLPLRIHDWEDWQKEWYKYQARLEADRNSKRKRRAEEATAKKFAEPPVKVTAPPSKKETLSIDEKQEKSAAQKGKEYSASFRELWEIYPRKDDKSRAYAMYRARLKEGYSEEELLQATKGYAAEMKKKKQAREYILMGKTFFGADGRFSQYIPKQAEKRPQETTSGNPFGEWGG